ncbi:MAG: hypothetical protein WD600_13250, partial [Pseudohongiella sp.]
VQENSAAYDEAARRGSADIIYRFDHNVLDASALSIGRDSMQIQGHSHSIALQTECAYNDMLDDDQG